MQYDYFVADNANQPHAGVYDTASGKTIKYFPCTDEGIEEAITFCTALNARAAVHGV